MHRLASDLGVTPRALYNHIRDRQHVVDLVAALMMQRLPVPEFDTTDWRESLRVAYREARAAYRSFPRATLISLDETVTATDVDPRRVTSSERMLGFLTGVGLTLSQALVMRRSFLTDLFGFVLLIDCRFDQGNADTRRALAHPVPEPWLNVHRNVDAPMSREAVQQPEIDSDTMFEQLVELRIAAIEHLLEQQPGR